MMAKSKIEKILVCGDVEGNFDQLFKRVSSVNKKNGPFSMLLCVGDFFGLNNDEWEAYKSGAKKVPVTTYLLGPNQIDLKKYFTDERGCELAENVIYLGPCGIYPCSSGLRIAYLSGRNSSPKGVSYNNDNIKVIEVAAGKKQNVDILITSDWPQGICNFSFTPNNYNSTSSESALVSRLAFKIKPRYHFAGTAGFYYERLPYRNHKVLNESAKAVTRFIGLGKVGNVDKVKWIYAFNIAPMKHLDTSELIKQPDDVTEFPFSDDVLKEEGVKPMEGPQFFYDMNAPMEEGGNKRKYDANNGDRKRKPPKPTGPCWFCLSSPDVEKHLVVSVGTYSYLAMAKGGLTKTHLLIMPIEHFQSTPDLESECLEEINKFKRALEKMFSSIGRCVVFFERNYRTQHLQVQAVAVPDKDSSIIKGVFLEVSEDSDISLDEIPKHSDLSQLAPPGTPFFYAELPSGDRLFHRIKKGFPIQFGREVLASEKLLNVPDKVDWRECKSSMDEETSIRDRVRTAFKPFDFTLDDDDDSDDESD